MASGPAQGFDLERYRPAAKWPGLAALVLCFALASSRAGYGQTTDLSPWFTRVGFAPAYVVATNPFSLRNVPSDKQINAVPGITVEIGRQTEGSRDWHRLYGFP